jgi:hypothetical protein
MFGVRMHDDVPRTFVHRFFRVVHDGPFALYPGPLSGLGTPNNPDRFTTAKAGFGAPGMELRAAVFRIPLRMRADEQEWHRKGGRTEDLRMGQSRSSVHSSRCIAAWRRAFD